MSQDSALASQEPLGESRRDETEAKPVGGPAPEPGAETAVEPAQEDGQSPGRRSDPPRILLKLRRRKVFGRKVLHRWCEDTDDWVVHSEPIVEPSESETSDDDDTVWW